MSKLLVNDVMAKAFAAEGVDVLFTLMGDGNMHWLAKMADAQGVRLVHARHEHSACSMAHGYAHATGKVGVASTTCGPGYTQIMTALAQAAHGRVPMVVFAGDAPIGASWYLQEIDMGPLARGSGAHYIPIRSIDRVLDGVREAFIIAASERKPVVLSVPMDLQRQPYPHLPDYQPSSEWLPAPQRPLPDPAIVDRVAEMIAQARRPMIIAGRGAVQSGARQAIEALAERSGAILATSLMGKGLFDGTPFAMDIAGSFGSDLLHELFAEADLVIGIGASLGYYTTEGGYLYPGARVVQIDVAPRGCWQGQRTADVHVCADARAAAEALVAALERQGVRNTGLRTPELARRIASDVPDSKEFPVQPGMVDPRHAMAELDRAVPKDWDIVIGLGHYFSMALTNLRGRASERYHVVADFGGIGSALPAAIGVAAARGDRNVLLIEGDGSLMLHIQELETARRHGMRILAAVVNDGGYGAEVHKFRAQGIQTGAAHATHGRGDLAGIASAFGWSGSRIDRPGQMQELFRRHVAGETSSLWDIHTDDRIASRAFRRVHYGEA